MYGLIALIRNLLLLVVVITVLRSVIGLVMKFLGGALSGSSGGSRPGPGAKTSPAVPLSGDLHRDPVCGTFVASSTAFQRQQGGERFYYCSEACRSQHILAAR